MFCAFNAIYTKIIIIVFNEEFNNKKNGKIAILENRNFDSNRKPDLQYTSESEKPGFSNVGQSGFFPITSLHTIHTGCNSHRQHV